MSINTDLIYDAKRKMLVKYPRFGSEIAVSNIEFRTDLKYHTAATDGKNIFIDPEYFASLNDEERMFLIAHEIMHIKFMHAYRLANKDGTMRDSQIWNIATDAIINANLERDGFTIKKGYVNMPEALKYTAEEFYDILLQEKNKKEQSSNENGKSSEKGNSSEKEETSENSQSGEKSDDSENGQSQTENQEKTESQTEEQEFQGDDHSMWEEAFEKFKDGEEKSSDRQSYSSQSETPLDQDVQIPERASDFFDEKSEFENNRKEKIERFKNKRKQSEEEIRGESKSEIKLGDIGESADSIDWKILIRREIDKTETIWSQRRSIAENNYAYRLEENDIEDEAETEVMIDVSGSVDLNLVKAFLRQLKPLLKQSKLRVGCFNEKFWGLVNINSVKDIENFTIPNGARGRSAWTEDWDLAVRSFTKKKEINKIVFTDGYPCPGTMPKEDLKRENIIWLVYGNKNFKPCCGKVINITEKQLEKLNQIEVDDMR